MRYVRIFFIYLQDVFEYRSIAVVWFLVSVINPLLYLMFWRGTMTAPAGAAAFSSVADVTSYYLLYLILGGFLMAHIEHEVAYWDIKEGGLVKYILKPFSYFSFKFLQELSWRIVMGLLALTAYLVLTYIFGHLFSITLTPFQWMIVLLSCVLWLLVAFVFKMIIGLTALWVVEFNGIEQTVFVASLLFSGYVVPLDMSPRWVQFFAYLTPFPYILYYPIRLIQGKVSSEQSLMVIGIQLVWLILLGLLYKVVWSRGAKRFTGVGL